MLHVIMYTVIKCVWKQRNEIIFKGSHASVLTSLVASNQSQFIDKVHVKELGNWQEEMVYIQLIVLIIMQLFNCVSLYSDLILVGLYIEYHLADIEKLTKCLTRVTIFEIWFSNTLFDLCLGFVILSHGCR